MPASPIRKLVPYAEQAKRDGKKIYHLNIGQPDIKTPQSALDAVKNADIEVLAYSHSAGNESYRRKLVGYYAQHDIHVTHEDIIVTTGASEAILFTVMSCLNPGDEIIVPEPFYANYNGFALAGGVHVTPITATIDTGFALPPIADFEAVITDKTKAILICNPSNPTGYLYSRAELEALRDIAIKHDLFLFVDEVYREFAYEGQEHISMLTLPGIEEHVVVMDSISKRYSACGARVGAIVSKNKAFMATVMKFAQARLSPPTLAQILAEATLDVDPTYLTEAIAEYDIRRKALIERLHTIEGVVCPNPVGAFYAFVQLPIDDAERFCQWMLEEFDHNGETVMMAPGNGFYATPGLGKQEVRIAYVLHQDDLMRALDALEAGLKAYPGRTL